MFSVKCHVAQHRYQETTATETGLAMICHLRADELAAIGRSDGYYFLIAVIDNRQNGVDHVACHTRIVRVRVTNGATIERIWGCDAAAFRQSAASRIQPA